MTDTLVTTTPPSYSGTGGTVELRMLNVQFGDGFIQTTTDGLNPARSQYTIVWDPIPADEASTIEAWLRARVGQAFYFRLPREQAPRTFVCTSIRREFPLPNHDRLTIMIDERFVY